MLWYYQRSLIDLDAIPNFVNGVKREGVKVSPDLAFGLFSYLPLHKIRYGIKQGIVKRADAMIKRLRSWWQITIKPLFVIEAMVFLVGIIVIILGYWLKWSWTGFSAKKSLGLATTSLCSHYTCHRRILAQSNTKEQRGKNYRTAR